MRTSRWPFVPRMVGFVGISTAMIMILVAAGSPTPLLPIYEHEWGFPSWMLTLAFGVYAIALLVAILVIGSLSDHVGRRPLMIGALALELIAMGMFVEAHSIGGLIAARIVQGIATGAASSTLSASVVELAPERHKKTGALMAGLAPLAGLGIGSLFAGIIAQTVANAAPVIWTVLIVVMALATVFAIFTPETSTRKKGALRSLIPSVSLPKQVRRLFFSTLPGTIGAFMTMALFLGLLPALLAGLFAVTSPIVGALAAFVMFGVGTLVSAATLGAKPHRLRILGAASMTVGAILFIAAIGAHALPLVWTAAVFGGAGLGANFSGTTRGLVPEVKPHERAALFSTIYLVAYLSMGVSAIIAGAFVAAIGATTMALLFGAVLGIFALIGIITTAGHLRASRA
ncbi:MFS transporter [Frondihabitans australicus]|uniref:Putative MFS family arabinose efflux permease n=1 Tax=Frondihabitans australicus TaxID=386892 RepID=A0A495IKW5_9MICO|nr:MFS transporter [Frondihabitans australicus]RKR75796.1 putative MFS family arabinose efflux permease [Frondihabitans australicus]